MMKINRTRAALAANFFALLYAIFLAGCANGLTGLDSTAANGAAGTVPVTISLTGSTDGGERTVAPSTNPAIAEYQLFCGASGGAQSLIAKFAAITPASKVNVAPGTLDFTLKAFNAAGVELLEGYCDGIVLASTPVSLAFSLCPLASGSGTVSVTVTWPASVSVATVVPVLAGTADSAVSVVGAQTYTYAKALERGGYLLTISLRDSGGLEIASVPEYVKVYPNMPSVATFNLAVSDFNSAPVAPTGLSAVSAGNISDSANASVSLSWTDASLNEKNFEIQYSDDDGANWTGLSSSVAAATATFATTLARGASRTYRVRASNDFGASDWATSAKFAAPWLFTFDSQGGSAVTTREVSPASVTAKPQDPTKYGSLFGGWYTDATFATAWDFAANAITANTTVFAKWTKAIVLNPNRGEGSPVSLSWTSGTTANLPANTFTRPGYTFVGWSLEPLGSVKYADGASYTMADGDTLYARWNRSDAESGANFNITIDATTKKVTINSYKTTSVPSTLVIPDLIGGNPVTVIGYGAFSGKTSITSLALPESLVTIGNQAFYGCSGLTSLVVPEGCTKLESSSFYNCKKLVSVSLPSTLSGVGDYAFYGCAKLTALTLPSSLTLIGPYAFQYCAALTSITIPPSVTSLGQYSFQGCTGLKTAEIASNISDLPVYLFQGCTSLETVRITGDVHNIGGSYYSGTPGPFCDCTSLKTVELPADLRVIGESSFTRCISLESFTVPSSVTLIGNSAFQGCSGLKSLMIDDAAAVISSSAFSDCSSLASVSLGAKITEINSSAFMNCARLPSIVVPVSAKKLGNNAFYGCASLKTATLGSGITQVQSATFQNCTSLESVSLPTGLTLIDSNAFNNCAALGSIAIPTGVKTIGTYAFADCQSLAAISIPDTVKDTVNTYNNLVPGLGQNAFQNCKSLVTALIGNGVTTISQYDFDGCESLKTVTIGTSVTTIDGYAFKNCVRLQNVPFPASLTAINASAFENCDAMTSVSLPDAAKTLGERAFFDCDGLAILELGTGIKAIQTSAFEGCDALSSVSLGATPKTIAASAFARCPSIEALELSSVTSLGEKAFYQATKLKSLILGPSLASISPLAFAGCSSLETVRVDALAPPVLTSENSFALNAPNRVFKVKNFDDDSILARYKTTGLWASFNDSIFEQ